MKQKWEMCTTAELVKVSRGNSAPLPLLSPGPFSNIRPMHFPAPLQIIQAQPGGRMLGPTLIPARLPGPPGHRLPIRTLSPIMNQGGPGPRSQNSPAPIPPQSSQPNQNLQKPKFQVQANAVNVPDSVRKSMAPPPAANPENFKVPSIKDQKAALKEKNSLIPNRKAQPVQITEDTIDVQKPESQVKSEKHNFILPTDLLDDHDAEDQSNVETNHPPTELLGSLNHNPEESDQETPPSKVREKTSVKFEFT